MQALWRWAPPPPRLRLRAEVQPHLQPARRPRRDLRHRARGLHQARARQRPAVRRGLPQGPRGPGLPADARPRGPWASSLRCSRARRPPSTGPPCASTLPRRRPPVARDVLLEIGTEELPASFVEPALADLRRIVTERLAAAHLPHGEVRTYGTPRRLALHVAGVAETSEDTVREVTGPAARAAFDAEGKPTTRRGEVRRERGLHGGAAAPRDHAQGRVPRRAAGGEGEAGARAARRGPLRRDPRDRVQEVHALGRRGADLRPPGAVAGRAAGRGGRAPRPGRRDQRADHARSPLPRARSR